MESTQGTLFVVSAPSGAGKTSLVKAATRSMDRLVVSVSHTTRPRRASEIDGLDYHFVDHQQFRALISAGEMLEYARVFGNQYGTARRSIVEHLAAGCDVILEIDWQGARQVRREFPGSQSIFILPPSRAALRARLAGRAQDSDLEIAGRMQQAANDMSHWHEFDFLIVNEDFDVATEELRCIVRARRLCRETQGQAHRNLIEELVS